MPPKCTDCGTHLTYAPHWHCPQCAKNEVPEQSEDIPNVKMIDPPEGWKYGFPKVYDPEEGEDLHTWLARKGYPVEGNETIINMATRFWDDPVLSKEQREQLSPMDAEIDRAMSYNEKNCSKVSQN